MNNEFGIFEGEYVAYGYKYICPLVIEYLVETENLEGHFSCLGLDRTSTPHRLLGAKYIGRVDGEYDDDISRSIVTFWDLDPDTGLLTGSDRVVEASDVAYASQRYIQGLNAANDRVWLYIGTEFKLLLRTIDGAATDDDFDWSYRGEGLSWSESTDFLWNVTEKPGYRVCFAVRRANVE